MKPGEKVKPPGVELKQQLNARFEALKTEAATWRQEWQEIAEHMRPRAFRRHRAEANKGDKKHQRIINFTPLKSARTLASGMMSGITSPSRPWFRLTVEGAPALNESPAVKAWLSESEAALREDLAKSNVYKALHLVYADLGPFSTSAMLVDEDDEDGARAYVFPVGSYVLACGPRGDVDTLFREVSLTVLQVVKQFGLEACSTNVRNAHRDRRFDERVDVIHAVMPNEERREGALGPEGKVWLSYWWEAAGGTEVGFLRVGGYEERPIMAPRWEVTGEDTYGHGPGFAALGDCKALQYLEKKSAQATDKIVNPPMAAPTSASTAVIDLLPGKVSYVDGLGVGQALRPVMDLNPNALTIFDAKIQRHELRIREAFFADLWLMLSETSGQMTAREVQERREEKLLQLGTVLEALQDELLDPLIDRLFGIALRRGRIPPPPEELQGRPLKVEYVSIMAQAQKLLSVTGIERIATFAGNLAALKPEVLDKLDLDQLIDELADSLGVPPAIIRTDEAVAALRQARAEAQQKQAAAEQGMQAAQAAKTLSETDVEGNNGLTELLRGAGVR